MPGVSKPSIRWLRLASRDLERQIDYVASDSPRAAAGLVERVETAIARLAGFPLSGRSGRVAGTRELIVEGTPFVVVYRAEERWVSILRVLHGAQKWPPETRG